MDEKPAQPPRGQSPEVPGLDGDPRASEQFGRVELERLLKDDGRALLVFRRLPAQ